MIFLAFLLNFGLVLGSRPFFKSLQDSGINNFNVRNYKDDSYRWGYRYPGQYHQETKEDDQVTGSFGYVDALGNPVHTVYRSDPVNGFLVNDFSDYEGDSNVGVQVKSVNFNQPIKDVGITNRVVPAAVLLKSYNTFDGVLLRALDTNAPILKSGLDGGYPAHFFISPELIQEAGGVSAAAVKYGAAPIAAVHDANVPRYY